MRFRLVSIISISSLKDFASLGWDPCLWRLCPFHFLCSRTGLSCFSPSCSSSRVRVAPREPGVSLLPPSVLPAAGPASQSGRGRTPPPPGQVGSRGGPGGVSPCSSALPAPATLQTLQRRGSEPWPRLELTFFETLPHFLPPPPSSTRPSGTFEHLTHRVESGDAQMGRLVLGSGELLGPLLADGSPACRDDGLPEPRRPKQAWRRRLWVAGSDVRRGRGQARGINEADNVWAEGRARGGRRACHLTHPSCGLHNQSKGRVVGTPVLRIL